VIDPNESIQFRQFSGNIMLMLMKCLTKRLGTVRKISQVCLPCCCVADLVRTKLGIGVHSQACKLFYPAAMHVLQCCYLVTSQVAYSSLVHHQQIPAVPADDEPRDGYVTAGVTSSKHYSTWAGMQPVCWVLTAFLLCVQMHIVLKLQTSDDMSFDLDTD